MGKVVYRSKWVTISEENVKIKGKSYKFIRTTEPDVSVVVPILPDGKIIIERQYRHMMGGYHYELPAGHMEKGEDPALTAKRELEEETGYIASKIIPMFWEFHSPGSGKRKFFYYLAVGLKKGLAKPEDTEEIEIIKMSAKELEKRIKTGKINDQKTIAGYLYYKNFLQKSWAYD